MVPPLEVVAVKTTVVPAHTVVAEAAMVTAGVTFGATTREKAWLADIQPVAFFTVMLKEYVPATTLGGMDIFMGEAGNEAFTTSENAAITGDTDDILYVTGDPVVAVYGSVKTAVPAQILFTEPKVIVGKVVQNRALMEGQIELLCKSVEAP